MEGGHGNSAYFWFHKAEPCESERPLRCPEWEGQLHGTEQKKIEGKFPFDAEDAKENFGFGRLWGVSG